MELKPIYVFSKTKQINLTRKELNELLQTAFNQGFYVGSGQQTPTTEIEFK